MSRNPDLTSKFEDERLRAQDQSQIVYLQGQIDELRRQIKDQTNKYGWVIEQVRRVEGTLAQVQGLFEQQSEEVKRTVEVIRRDVTGLRKEVSGALVKVEEGVRPLREMQSQIQQVAEARRQDRDYVSGWFERITALEQRNLDLQAQIKDIEERHRQYGLQLERLREADGLAIQELRKVGEDLQIEKQALRRQAVESQQLVTDFQGVIEDHRSRLDRLDEIRKQIELFAETLPAQYADLAARMPELNAEIKRVERMMTERFLMSQERSEEIRQQADARIDTLQETDEQHLRQLTAWLERIDGLLREFEQRLNRSTSRLEEGQRDQFNRILELENRELASIRALAESFRERSEAVRAAQVEIRGGDDTRR